MLRVSKIIKPIKATAWITPIPEDRSSTAFHKIHKIYTKFPKIAMYLISLEFIILLIDFVPNISKNIAYPVPYNKSYYY